MKKKIIIIVVIISLIPMYFLGKWALMDHWTSQFDEAWNQSDYKDMNEAYLKIAFLSNEDTAILADLEESVVDALKEKTDLLLINKSYDLALYEVIECLEYFSSLTSRSIAINNGILELQASNKFFLEGENHYNNLRYDEALESFSYVIEKDTDNFDNVEIIRNDIYNIFHAQYIENSKNLLVHKAYDEAIEELKKALVYKDDEATRELIIKYQEERDTAIKAEQERLAEEARLAEAYRLRSLERYAKYNNWKSLWGYVDGNNEWAITARFLYAGNFINDKAPVATIEKDIVEIDRNNNVLRVVFDMSTCPPFTGNSYYSRILMTVIEANQAGHDDY